LNNPKIKYNIMMGDGIERKSRKGKRKEKK
jgi:hypothetical protein